MRLEAGGAARAARCGDRHGLPRSPGVAESGIACRLASSGAFSGASEAVASRGWSRGETSPASCGCYKAGRAVLSLSAPIVRRSAAESADCYGCGAGASFDHRR